MRTMQSPERGFTLIELMLAVVILGVVVVSAPLAGLRLRQTASDSRVRNEANALADDWIARCRAEPNYAALDSTGTGRCQGTVTGLGSFNFSRTTTVTSDATLSGVADSLNDYRRITVVVTSTVMSPAVQRTVTVAR